MTKPAHVHLFEGSHRKDRHGDLPKRFQILEEQKRIPTLPPEEKSKLFDYFTAHLMRLGVSDEVDALQIEMLANLWSDYREIRAYIDTNGIDVKLENKLAVTIANELVREMNKLMQSMFLTPHTREKVRLEDKVVEADPVAEFLDS